eukprot:m.50570 g.50570  ORF g.50570 m.50570 type:complete len:795 (-) comp10679_c1_seq1:122-2506(-)
MPEPQKATQDQDKLLEEALQVVKVQSFQMKRSLDGTKLMEGLKHASNMLGELRTSLLSPKAYYELYMAISDELRHLELYLVDEFEKGNKISDLYELVQYAGNIIPRLYLLVTVGTVYIKAKQVPTKDILKDLVEMCRGVQHPLRGLFLRNYLLQSIKRDLPEEVIESKHGSVEDSIDFVLLNFAEMNKLWVRMQHQGHSRDKTQREKERRELRILVGTNLVRLSSLEGVTQETYQKKILPAIMEQIVSCKDPIAQEYLMECIIQVFPDEQHLQTLGQFLDAVGSLHANVNVKNIVISLIERLTAFALRDNGVNIPSNMNLFEIFAQKISDMIKQRKEMPLEDIISLRAALVGLAVKVYADKKEYVDKVFEYTIESLKEKLEETKLDHSKPAARELVSLIKSAVDENDSIMDPLRLPNFVELFPFFVYDMRKELALYLLQNVTDKGTQLDDVELVDKFFSILGPLIKDEEGQDPEEDDEDFSEEQSLVGRYLSLLHSDTPDMLYQIISTCKKQLSQGGPLRVKYTMPPLVFQALKLSARYQALENEDDMWQKKLKKIFTFCHQIITGLVKADYHDLAFRLFLQAALGANKTSFDATESIAYEFMSQAITLYEEEVSDSSAQIKCITLLVGTLEQMSCFGEENYATLATKSAVMSSKLVKKPDQARGVSLCSHVFWSSITLETKGEEQHDGKQVKKCLSKGRKIATSSMDNLVQAAIFVEVLNRCMLYYEWAADEITIEMVNELGRETKEALEKLEEDDEEGKTIKQHFENTLGHIKDIQNGEGEGDRRYQDCNLV